MKTAGKYGSMLESKRVDDNESLEISQSNLLIDDKNEHMTTNNADFSQNISNENNTYNTYIIEPVAFMQNLASCIMGISFAQFIYNRILNRLIDQAKASDGKNATTTTAAMIAVTNVVTTNNTGVYSSAFLSSTMSPNRTDACGHLAPNASMLEFLVMNCYDVILQQPQQPSLLIANLYSTKGSKFLISISIFFKIKLLKW